MVEAEPTAAAADAAANGVKTLRQQCQELHRRLERFLQEEPANEVLRATQEQTRKSITVVQEALKRYRLPALSLSYNGGKDCLVLLILYLACLADMPSLPSRLESIYIVSDHPFTEVDDFVDVSSRTYHLSLERMERASMKDAFAEYLDRKKNIEAIFVGTRRTDPHGHKLTSFDMTDGGWPRFMRIHPVIDWHYREIWTFIRHLEIPYCVLYDMGYTSLGGTEDTHPNPALRVTGSAEGEDKDVYAPAWRLEEDEEERLGRDRNVA